MFTLTVGATESFDESKEEFVEVGGFDLEFEHSLVSLSKWESIHEKPFLSKQEKTDEETLSYIQCMLVTQNPPENWLGKLTQENFNQLSTYVDAKQTATTFRASQQQAQSREVITSELIYYWMIAATIPIECESWHLNRLFTLIRVCSVKNEKPKKMSQSEIAARNRELNAQRRQQLGSNG